MKLWDENTNIRKVIFQLLIIISPIVLVLLLVSFQSPNNTSSSDTFSSETALGHIKKISESPRAVGMAGHKKSRDYLSSTLEQLGLETDIQNSFAVNTSQGLPYRTGFVSNVIGRLRGTGNGDAILLIAHYDSVANGNGVSDNAVGVGILLEAIESFKNKPTNDFIILFSDAEEIGLLGAKAFLNEHDWAKHVKAVINLEARGTSGPSLLFETSANSSELVKAYSASVESPTASSFFSDIYKILPNDTDFTVFKKKGISGLNMAYIENVNHYHTRADSLENLSEGSLIQQGGNLVSIVNELKDKNLDSNNSGELVFFDLFGKTMIYYSQTYVLPLAGLVVILFGVSIFFGRKSENITIKGVLLGSLMFFLSFILAIITSLVLQQLIIILHSNYQLLSTGNPYQSYYYVIGICLLVTAQTYLIYSLLEKKWDWENLYFGVIFWWVLLAVVTSFLLPGTSYIFTLSALSLLAFTLIRYLLKTKSKVTDLILLSAGSLVGIVLVSGIIRHVVAGLGLFLIPVIIFFIFFLIGVVLFQILNTEAFLRKFIFSSIAMVGIILIIFGLATVEHTESDPVPSNLFWAMDIDKNEAFWASSDAKLNDWNESIFSEGAKKVSIPDFFPMTRRTFYQQKSESVNLSAPEVETLSDTTNGDTRIIKLRIKSTREAPIINLILESEGEVVECFVEGEKVSDESFPEFLRVTPWETRIQGVPSEGVNISLKLKLKESPLKIRVVEQSYGLPESNKLKIYDRPEKFVSVLPFGNSTFTTKTFVIEDQ